MKTNKASKLCPRRLAEVREWSDLFEGRIFNRMLTLRNAWQQGRVMKTIKLSREWYGRQQLLGKVTVRGFEQLSQLSDQHRPGWLNAAFGQVAPAPAWKS